MALWDESRGPFLAVLVGAGRRGAGGVGAQTGPHGGGNTRETKWQHWQAAAAQRAKGAAAARLGEKDSREGLTPSCPGPHCPSRGLMN